MANPEMKFKEKWARAMKGDWDRRARLDAFHYSTWKTSKRWDRDSYFASGERDYMLFVEPFLKAVGLEPDRSKMLELGCGVGRMTGSLARRFDHVYSVDVSREMVSRAQSFNEGLTNVTWQVVDGFELPEFQDAQIDFVFSFLVFQHVPQREIIMSNIGEMLRILKPGGFFLFQYNGEYAPRLRWKERVVWGILDRWQIPVVPRLFGIDVGEAGKTWNGAALGPKEVAEQVQSHGGTVTGTRGSGTPAAWCWGVKRQ